MKSQKYLSRSIATALFIQALLLLSLLPNFCVASADIKNNTAELTTAATVLDMGLQVFIEPSGARAAGAQWKTRRCDEYQQPAGDWSPWLNHGHVDTTYMDPDIWMEIEFKAINGWNKPNNMFVFTSYTDVTTATGTYVQTGSVKVIIEPDAVVAEGARWRRVGTSDWWRSGETETGLLPGDYYVEFKEVDGWAKPANRWVYVIPGHTDEITANYTEYQGSLRVSINPSGARFDGAQWRAGTTGEWNDSGKTILLPKGTHTVYFKSLRGWISPVARAVEITRGQNTAITVSYSRSQVGKIWVLADNFTKTGNSFTASGNVAFALDKSAAPPGATPPVYTSPFVNVSGSVNGTFSPAEINGDGTFSISGITLPVIGNLPFYSGPFTLDADTFKITNIEFFPVWQIWGWDVEIYYLQLFYNPAGIGFGLKITLPEYIYGEDSYCEIQRFEVKTTGIAIIGEVHITDCTLFKGFFTLNSLHGSIDTTTGSFSIIVDKLAILDLPAISASLIIENKKLKEVSGGAYNMNIQIPDTPIYFQDLALSLKDPSADETKISLDTIAFTCFERIGTWSLLEFAGNATIDFSGHLALGVYVTVLGWDFQHATFDLWWDLGFAANVLWREPKFLLTVQGLLQVWWYLKPAFWSAVLVGTIGFDIPDWISDVIKFFKPSWDKDSLYLASGTVIASNDGFKCSADILGIFTASFTIPPFWESAPPPKTAIVGLQTTTISETSPAKADSFNVPEESPTAIFSAKGESGLPDVVLTLPDGSTFDSRDSLPENNNDFVFIQDADTNVTAFFFRNPQAGRWKLSVKNSGVAGDTEVFFVTGNNAPNVIPKKIEKVGDNKYKLIANAFDPDETAKVTFYWNKDNETFLGTPIGTVDENDGRLEYTWTPSANLPFKNGYVYATIKDSSDQMRSVYFDEKLNIGQTEIAPPRMSKCKVVKDTVRFKTGIRNAGIVDKLRVYYSDDLKQKELSDYVNLPVGKKVKLTETHLKPGRKYQARLSSVAEDGSESPMSKRRVFDYKAKKINNHPHFISDPVLECSVGGEYAYKLKARDYDNDDLEYSVVEGPEGMTLNAAACELCWQPEAANAGVNFVTLKVTDGKGGEDVQKFAVIVNSATTPVRFATVELIETGNGSLLVVRVKDHLAGSDPYSRETLAVNIDDKWRQDEIELQLLETAGGSNEFQGTLRIDDNNLTAPVWLAGRSEGAGSVEAVITWRDKEGEIRKDKALISEH